MGSFITNGLALVTLGFALARASEQLGVGRRKTNATGPWPAPHRASALAPSAGAAVLVYAHSIGADLVLLIATYLHTSAAFIVWARSSSWPQGRSADIRLGAQDVGHD